MTDLVGVKSGDTLFVFNRWNKWVDTVDRVTPTGRVILKNGTQFNPDGWKRGESGWDHTRARLATEDDIAGINRTRLVGELKECKWDKLSPDDLKTVAEIAGKYRDKQ